MVLRRINRSEWNVSTSRTCRGSVRSCDGRARSEADAELAGKCRQSL